MDQAASNLLTTLGQFFHFVVLFEAPFQDEDPEELPLTLEMLLCPIRMRAFGTFLTLSERAPQTVCNRMTHLGGVLKQMKANPRVAKKYGARIKASRQVADEVRRAAAARVPRTRAEEDGMADKVRAGRMFASRDEHDAFTRWCLNLFDEGIKSYEERDGELDLKRAGLMQSIVATLMMDFSGGQRRQVIAELTMEGIDWCSHREWAKKQLTIRPGVEKVNRLTRGRLPLPNFLRGHVAVLTQIVRPVLLGRRRALWLRARAREPEREGEEFVPTAVEGLWIDAHGGAMRPQAFTKALAKLSATFNPHLHIVPRSYRYTYLTDVDRLLSDWDPADGDLERSVSEFVNARRDVRHDNYDRSCPTDRHVRVQEMMLRPRLKELSEDIRKSCDRVQPLLERLVAEQHETAPPVDEEKGPGRMVRTTVDDLEWQRQMVAYRANQRATQRKKNGGSPSRPPRGRFSSAKFSRSVKQAMVRTVKPRNRLSRKVDKKLTLAQHSFRKERFPKVLKPFEDPVSVTPMMRKLARKNLRPLDEEPVERIVRKGICLTTNKIMYQVAWYERIKCSWEYKRDLKKYDHMKYEIERFENTIWIWDK